MGRPASVIWSTHMCLMTWLVHVCTAESCVWLFKNGPICYCLVPWLDVMTRTCVRHDSFMFVWLCHVCGCSSEGRSTRVTCFLHLCDMTRHNDTYLSSCHHVVSCHKSVWNVLSTFWLSHVPQRCFSDIFLTWLNIMTRNCDDTGLIHLKCGSTC